MAESDCIRGKTNLYNEGNLLPEPSFFFLKDDRLHQPHKTRVQTVGPTLYNEAVSRAGDFRTNEHIPGINNFVPRLATTGITFTPHAEVHLAPKTTRAYIADLNPMIFARAVVQQEEPREYEHHNRRLNFMQYLLSDTENRTDPNLRPLPPNAVVSSTLPALINANYGYQPRTVRM